MFETITAARKAVLMPAPFARETPKDQRLWHPVDGSTKDDSQRAAFRTTGSNTSIHCIIASNEHTGTNEHPECHADTPEGRPLCHEIKSDGADEGASAKRGEPPDESTWHGDPRGKEAAEHKRNLGRAAQERRASDRAIH